MLSSLLIHYSLTFLITHALISLWDSDLEDSDDDDFGSAKKRNPRRRNDAKGWHIKCYKGLGTSTSKEGASVLGGVSLDHLRDSGLR